MMQIMSYVMRIIMTANKSASVPYIQGIPPRVKNTISYHFLIYLREGGGGGGGGLNNPGHIIDLQNGVHQLRNN